MMTERAAVTLDESEETYVHLFQPTSAARPVIGRQRARPLWTGVGYRDHDRRPSDQSRRAGPADV
jgi:hypothetical protein